MTPKQVSTSNLRDGKLISFIFYSNVYLCVTVYSGWTKSEFILFWKTYCQTLERATR